MWRAGARMAPAATRRPPRCVNARRVGTLESLYGLPCLGAACSAIPVTDIWR